MGGGGYKPPKLPQNCTYGSTVIGGLGGTAVDLQTVSRQSAEANHQHQKLEGKYSLESTDPRESEIRANLRPQFSVE